MPSKVIAQRELRNNISQVLRDAEAGAQFTITVRGKAVATLGPMSEVASPQTDVTGSAIVELLRRTPVDAGFAVDVKRLRDLEPPADDPWPTR
jgi:prevent-host-death family protein